jgi:hypothetical protein
MVEVGEEEQMAKHRLLVGASLIALATVVPTGLAAATPDDGEAYPPAGTTTTVKPAVVVPIPKTGADGTETWLKLGAGAVLVGGIMVAAAARRRAATTAQSS